MHEMTGRERGNSDGEPREDAAPPGLAGDLPAVDRAMGDVEAVLGRTVEEAGVAGPAIGHLVGAGGKRLRPWLTLACAEAVDPAASRCPPVEIAAAAELIHSASLLHDDVIDEGERRRGRLTSRLTYSNTVSILSGDHCLASAVELIQSVDSGVILAEALQTVKDLVTGELVQLEARGQLSIDEACYRRVCRLKTASLFVWCARAGGRWAGADDEALDALGRFAEAVGTAFQIGDDLLDLTGDDRFGKRLLDDLRQGRMTLPVIVAIDEDRALGEELEALFSQRTTPPDARLAGLRARIIDTTAPARVAAEVGQLLREALAQLERLPASNARAVLASRVRALSDRNA